MILRLILAALMSVATALLATLVLSLAYVVLLAPEVHGVSYESGSLVVGLLAASYMLSLAWFYSVDLR